MMHLLLGKIQLIKGVAIMLPYAIIIYLDIHDVERMADFATS